MHVHLPKEFHGWRELAKEVGIIVVGVLIALGFEQLVQEWHWRVEARHTRQSLINEIGIPALFAIERLALQQCLRERATTLAAKLTSGSAHWTGDPMVLGQAQQPVGGRVIEIGMPLAYRTPRRPWISDDWDTAKSSGVLGHMDRSDVRDFEFMFRNINELRSLQEEETTLEPQLSFLSFDQTLEPQSRVQALITLARLDYVNGLQGITARQFLSTIAGKGLQLGPLTLGRRPTTFDAATNKIVQALRERYGRCVISVRLTGQLK
jgi:hypothetical protein